MMSAYTFFVGACDHCGNVFVTFGFDEKRLKWLCFPCSEMDLDG